MSLDHKKWWRISILLSALFLTVLAYWPALRGGFVWDDPLVIGKNPLIKGTGGLFSIWFHTDFPLTVLVFWIEWLAWGNHPAGYHAVNLLLHLVNALLVWRLLARLKIPGAPLAAVLFAVHPICVASVAWVSELKNTLSVPFFLLSLYWYLDAEERDRKTTLWYGLSIGAFLLALLSKTSTVMLPVVLLACAWWQHGRITRRDCLRAAPYFLLALVFGLMTIGFQKQYAIGNATVQTEGFWGRLAGAGMALWFYLGKALLPVSQSMIYPRWTIDAGAPLSWLPLLLLGAACLLCWRFRSGWGRPALFGLGCFAVLFFPVLGFIDMFYLAISRVSDHFLYLPLIAILGLVAAVLSALLPRKVLGGVGTALALGLSVLAWQRAQVMASDEALWRDTLAKNPSAWTARNNLGCILAQQQQYDKAQEQFEASLKINPRNAQAHCNLARCLALRRRNAEAETHFRTALEIKPKDAEIQCAFASVLAGQGRLGEAQGHLETALRAEPDIPTRLQYASLLQARGKTGDAVAQYRQVLARDPRHIEALNNLAWLLATAADASVRHGIEAVQVAEKLNRLTGFRSVVPLGTLAAAYAEAGRFNEAVATGQQCADLAASTGNTQLATLSQRLLQSYRAGKPWHQPAVPKQ